MQGRRGPLRTWQWRHTLYVGTPGAAWHCTLPAVWQLLLGFRVEITSRSSTRVWLSQDCRGGRQSSSSGPGQAFAGDARQLSGSLPVQPEHPWASQVPGRAVALRWGPLYVLHLLSSPHTWAWGLFPSPAASSPAGLSSCSGHSCRAPDSPAACCVRSHPASLLPMSAGTTPGPRTTGPGVRRARQGCTILGPGQLWFQGAPQQLSPQSPSSRARPGVGACQRGWEEEMETSAGRSGSQAWFPCLCCWLSPLAQSV